VIELENQKRQVVSALFALPRNRGASVELNLAELDALFHFSSEQYECADGMA
jgi:hypothetical protein